MKQTHTQINMINTHIHNDEKHFAAFCLCTALADSEELKSLY